ncbi:MAG: hypothetical protein WHW07_05205 [Bacteroidales bacterium]
MPFIDKILVSRSLSIVGMEKNTGKTECLNYVIYRLKEKEKIIGLTSIGIDGESVDQVTETPKPEIEIYPGTIFITSEKHYKQKQLTAEILDITQKSTALGRLITARAKDFGKVICSGPSQTVWLKEIIDKTRDMGVDLFLVDGALSRKSSASPSITESMILTTGAAVAPGIDDIVKKTAFLVKLINIESFDTEHHEILMGKEKGLYIITKDNELIDTCIESGLFADKISPEFINKASAIFLSGILTDRFIELIRVQNTKKKIVILVKDFTKIFISKEKYYGFLRSGGEIRVLLKPNLIAICINPLSPFGYKLDSNLLADKLHDEIKLPIYDIKKI